MNLDLVNQSSVDGHLDCGQFFNIQQYVGHPFNVAWYKFCGCHTKKFYVHLTS